MFDRPSRPLAERVLGVDAHLEPYGVVLRLAVAGTLAHHDALLEEDFALFAAELGTRRAAEMTASEFVLQREALHDAARAAATDLRPAASHPDAELSVQVAVDLCSAIAEATAGR